MLMIEELFGLNKYIPGPKKLIIKLITYSNAIPEIAEKTANLKVKKVSNIKKY